MTDYYAHTPNENGVWHGLKDHIEKVSELAQRFAAIFGAVSLARFAAISHDIGKGSAAFQEYLVRCHEHPEKKQRGPDHKGAGALLACRSLDLLAFLVAGHHGGLKNSDDLKIWLKERAAAWPDTSIEQLIVQLGLKEDLAESLTPPDFIKTGRQAELFLRILFSCLVDADFLDTEAHFAYAKSALRGNSESLCGLWQVLEADQRKLAVQGEGLLHEARNTIYRECLAAALLEPGFFRLTVPTGGGKTRSGMAFALNHAMKYGKERIIVAIPYTSIIEQSADVYRGIFGSDAVLEHHSAVAMPDDEDDTDDPDRVF